jgi:hypothetical protein
MSQSDWIACLDSRLRIPRSIAFQGFRPATTRVPIFALSTMGLQDGWPILCSFTAKGGLL